MRKVLISKSIKNFLIELTCSEFSRNLPWLFHFDREFQPQTWCHIVAQSEGMKTNWLLFRGTIWLEERPKSSQMSAQIYFGRKICLFSDAKRSECKQVWDYERGAEMKETAVEVTQTMKLRQFIQPHGQVKEKVCLTVEAFFCSALKL